ncbi:MAG: hypothetical protein WCK93_12255 [Nitrosomonadales bacterium]
MTRKLITLLVLTFATTTAYAEGRKETAGTMTGKWNNTATHQNFSINKHGIVGRSAAVCGEMYQQKFSLEKGDKWLAEVARLAKNKDIPQSQFNAIAKEIDVARDYSHLQSSCGETGDRFIQVTPDVLLSMSCAEGSCLVVRHVRTR